MLGLINTDSTLRYAIKRRWASGENTKRKTAKIRKTAYNSVDDQVWDWFADARRRNIPGQVSEADCDREFFWEEGIGR
jgi:hypothetical protein